MCDFSLYICIYICSLYTHHIIGNSVAEILMGSLKYCIIYVLNISVKLCLKCYVVFEFQRLKLTNIKSHFRHSRLTISLRLFTHPQRTLATHFFSFLLSTNLISHSLALYPYHRKIWCYISTQNSPQSMNFENVVLPFFMVFFLTSPLQRF